WRASYAQVQRSHEQEMAVYRHLGDEEEGERFYHEVDESHLRREIEPWAAANLRRHCCAPPTPRLHVPLPPLPSRAVTSLRRCSSLPDDYLHPASSLFDRRASDKSTASRSHRRRSLPSDYLHPSVVIPTRRQSQSCDC
ncbi:hypothetical protein BaRGS_00016954, partial [Batillaria attramentaria]